MRSIFRTLKDTNRDTIVYKLLEQETNHIPIWTKMPPYQQIHFSKG